MNETERETQPAGRQTSILAFGGTAEARAYNMRQADQGGRKMKLTCKGREIEGYTVDYGDETVLVLYKDAGDAPNAEIVKKTDIVAENEPE